MRKLKWILCSVIIFVLPIIVSTQAPFTAKSIGIGLSAQNSGAPIYKNNEVIVVYKKGLTSFSIRQSFKDNQDEAIKKYFVSAVSDQTYALIRSKTLSTEELLEKYKADPSVEEVAPNYIGHMDAIPDDPDFLDQVG